MASPSDDRVCLYCEEPKPLHLFNREHVLPEAFGTYLDNLVLHGCVCRSCNDYFGRTLDGPLARDSKEGLDRFGHGLVTAKKGRRLGKRIAVRQRGGRFEGALLEWDLDPEGRALTVKPARQVGFACSEVGPFEWHRVEDVPSRETLRSKGFAYCVTGGLPEEEAKQVVAALGFEATVVVVHGDQRDADGMLDTTIEGKIDRTIRRAIAKIAFNYLAYHFPALSSMDQFRAIRRYVRFDEDPEESPVGVSTKSILGGIPEAKQVVAHTLTVAWDGRAQQVIARISLFSWAQYRVVLSRSQFLVPPLCISSGHVYNPYGKQIAPLTRRVELSAPLPLVTREEFSKLVPGGRPPRMRK